MAYLRPARRDDVRFRIRSAGRARRVHRRNEERGLRVVRGFLPEAVQQSCQSGDVHAEAPPARRIGQASHELHFLAENRSGRTRGFIGL